MVINLTLQDERTSWDLIGMLQDDIETCQIPIIISSALGREEELIRKFGISLYMTKPYPLRTLTETVAETLKVDDGQILYAIDDGYMSHWLSRKLLQRPVAFFDWLFGMPGFLRLGECRVIEVEVGLSRIHPSFDHF